jgi:glycosyltransferase involved in cell wall biosynthesis
VTAGAPAQDVTMAAHVSLTACLYCAGGIGINLQRSNETSDPQASAVTYSIVVPIYNEEAVVPLLLHKLDALLDRLDDTAEVIIVDDGSKDTGPIVLTAKCRSDPRYRFIRLPRNFGHQIAISAGLDAAQGQAVVVMDADLQDPPELVEEMIARWRDGFRIVYAKRATKTMALLKGAGASDINTEFFLTLPTRRRFAVPVERLLRRLPLGAQYLVSAKA